MKHQLQLRRCFELANATVPRFKVTPDGHKFVAESFATYINQSPGLIEFLAKPKEIRSWQYGKISIQYRILPPDSMVEVTAVSVVDPLDPAPEPTS
jgi:hypothetical protein